MNIPINEVAGILRLALDFTNNVVSKFDDEEYTKAVMTIYGKEPDYKELDALVESIRNATDVSTKEKSELLLAIADKRSAIRERELEMKQSSAETVNKGFEKKCEFVGGLVLFVLTGGLSKIPDGYRAIKRWFDDDLYIEP